MERIAGVQPVREALRARRRRLERLCLRDDLPASQVAAWEGRARRAGVPVVRMGGEVLRKGLPRGVRDQGVALDAGPLPELALGDLLAIGPEGPRLLVALDGVEDPRNLGAVARVAEAAGASGLILTSRRSPPLGAVASRASAGALEHLPVARVTNLARALDAARRAGFWVMGADPQDGADLFQLEGRIWRGDLAIVLGAEGRGLRPGVARRLDHRVRIPMAGRVASLNVASAAAVVLYEALRCRRAGAGDRRQGPASPRN